MDIIERRLHAVAASKKDREYAEQGEIDVVRQAHRAGATWGQIGAIYGITKQAARQRFGIDTTAQQELDAAFADFDEATQMLNEQGPQVFLAHEKRELKPSKVRRCGTRHAPFGGTCTLPVGHDGDHLVKQR